MGYTVRFHVRFPCHHSGLIPNLQEMYKSRCLPSVLVYYPTKISTSPLTGITSDHQLPKPKFQIPPPKRAKHHHVVLLRRPQRRAQHQRLAQREALVQSEFLEQ